MVSVLNRLKVVCIFGTDCEMDETLISGLPARSDISMLAETFGLDRGVLGVKLNSPCRA